MKFTNTVEHRDGTKLKVESFETREEAKTAARKTAKEYGMFRHAGHVVNYAKHIELFTNY